MNEIKSPKGWVLTNLNDVLKNEKFAVVDGPFGTQLHASDYTNFGIPLIRIQNITQNNFNNLAYISEEKFKKLERSAVFPNDILLTKRGTVGKISLFPNYLKKGLITANCAKISIHEQIHSKFILYFLASSFGQSQITETSAGSTRKFLNNDQIRNIRLNLAPLNEQHRIVSKIESIFSQIDARKEKLEALASRARSIYEIKNELKSSVLTKAFEGKLVRQDPDDEPAETLKKIHKDSKKETIVEKENVPKNWTVTSLDKIRLNKSRTIIPNKTKDQLFELYSIPAYNKCEPEIMPGNEIGSNKQIVEENTVLLSKINPKINRVWIVGNFSPYQKIASTEWIPFFQIDEINPKYLCYFMQNNNFRNFLSMNVSGIGGSLTRIRPTILTQCKILIPPLNEQKRILSKIESIFSKIDSTFSKIDGTENTVNMALTKLNALKSSVLKLAFEGKLVPQDPNDEPASVLLEKIKQKRSTKK